MKKLYFGDCLDILKQLHSEHPDGFIDLIYIDPPFNSKRDYNVLFESLDPSDTTAQKQAFADTWSNVSYLDTLNEIQSLDLDLYSFLKALDDIRISKSAIAYLTTMAIRIYYMHKVLKNTGSFYLHCDPTMSHYLKILCDLVYGQQNFRNEIIWKRKTGRGETNQKSNRFGTSTDIILFYGKTDLSTFNSQFNFEAQGYEEYVAKFFKNTDENGRKYASDNLSSPSPRPNLIYEYKGYQPPRNGWAISIDKMEEWDKEGKLIFPQNKDGRIRRKRYLDELEGRPVQNLWDDIKPISAQSQERLGYPTQKPESLLDRIISASSNEGDLIADFFCGCGTSIAAAERLKRNWIGVDISHLAIKLIVKRLADPYRRNKNKFREIIDSIEVSGMPKDIGSAKELARNTEDGRFNFQDWVVEVMLGGVCNPKKTADGGWDGYATFNITEKDRELILIEVKSGNVNVKNLREFIQVVNTKKAAIGVFVCFKEQVTKPMELEAKKEGYYDKKSWGDKYDRIQIVTVEDLLEGNGVAHPESTIGTFRSATKAVAERHKQTKLFD